MKNPKTGFSRLISAARFSRQGMASAYRHEAAFRQEFWAAVVLIPVAILLGDTWLESGVMIASLLLVLIVELLNSAIETVVDRIGEDLHELSGRAKDMGSAAVLLSLLLAAVVWLSVLFS